MTILVNRIPAIMCSLISLLIIAITLFGCVTHPPLPTVASVDLARYMGTWHEIALIPNRFQKVCASDTQARYRQDGDSVEVLNRCRRADGQIESAEGTAKVVEGSHGAKLKVRFFWPFYGNYWILALDPDYRWVLIGEPSREYGWILARTPTLDDPIVKQALDRAVELGYQRTAFQPSRQIQPLP